MNCDKPNFKTGTDQLKDAANDFETISLKSVPLIDIGPYFSGDHEAKCKVSRKVNAACRDLGFIYISGHNISHQLIDRTFQAAQRFFALPDEEKLKIHYEKSAYQRGYIPIGAESADATGKYDLVEGFDCGLEVSPDDPDCVASNRMLSPNRWPSALPGFREDVERYFSALLNLATSLFQIIALGFDMPTDFFDDKINKPIAQMRLLRYPPQDRSLSSNMGIGAHCDYECFTILTQDQIGGLQILNHASKWIQVPPVPGTFVLTMGEMMSRWTNNTFVATPHRVINISGNERYSIPFFFATNYDTVIRCLDSCTGQDNPPRYSPTLAGDYLIGRLKEIYAV